MRFFFNFCASNMMLTSTLWAARCASLIAACGLLGSVITTAGCASRAAKATVRCPLLCPTDTAVDGGRKDTQRSQRLIKAAKSLSDIGKRKSLAGESGAKFYINLGYNISVMSLAFTTMTINSDRRLLPGGKLFGLAQRTRCLIDLLLVAKTNNDLLCRTKAAYKAVYALGQARRRR